MCDKRFMPINRSNVGENVTINRCISTLISFSVFKKDCPSSTLSVCQAGGTHKFSWYVGLTPTPTIYPKIYIMNIRHTKAYFKILSTHKKIPFCTLTLRNDHKIHRNEIIQKSSYLKLFSFLIPYPPKSYWNLKFLPPKNWLSLSMYISECPLPHGVQLRSQNAEKVTHNDGRLLNEVILFKCATFQNGNFS